MRQHVFVFMVTLGMVGAIATGCARSTTRNTAMGPSASVPTAATDVVGTWRGGAWELGGGVNASRTNATLQLNPDQTWSAVWQTNKMAEQKASGTYDVAGNRVTLHSSNRGTAKLVHRGDALYGLLDSSVAGLDVEVSLKKAQ